MVAVAIIDTGLTPGAGSRCVLDGVNVTGEGRVGDTGDRSGHGTSVAGTVLAAAPQATLVPVRALSAGGVLRQPRHLESALAWVADHRQPLGIGVVCMALGDAGRHVDDRSFRDQPVSRAIAGLREDGVVTVVAAGSRAPGLRDAGQGMPWPAVLREAVSVGAARWTAQGALGLEPRARRLHADLATGCATTVFAVPGPPGGSSGAAALVAGRLASLRAELPNAGVDTVVAALLRQAQVVRDGQGREWACLAARPDDGPGGSHHGSGRV